MVIHTNRGFNDVLDVHPLIGVIVAEMPQVVSEEGYMLGRQMIDVCLAADAAAEKHDTIIKGFGDVTYEMVLHLESAAIALLGPHVMVEQQAEAVSTDFQSKDGKPYCRLPCLQI